MNCNSGNYLDFFLKAAGPEKKPYAYQCRLACGEKAGFHQVSSLEQGNACHSLQINIPTGLGKTAAVIAAWLWNRVARADAAWPRRLVYCLPMRSLVEQTQKSVIDWLKNAGLDKEVDLHLLMGGEKKSDFDIHPERNAILIGTQDMLLSRALNRGYGLGRARWPMPFGLLNNDCLWVFDEVQLMGNGLATGIQLDGFRTGLWPTARPCVSWFMSATTSPEVFATTDRVELGVKPPPVFALTPVERTSGDIAPRLNPEKKIEFLGAIPKPAEILQGHQKGRLTLLIANTIKSATDWFDALQAPAAPPAKKGKKAKAVAPTVAGPEIVLIHSRFRPKDRAVQMKRLMDFLELVGEDGTAGDDHPGMILVATQVVEAGFDISAATLFSEIAPWASAIQRLGRLNRDNRHSQAVVKFWKAKANKEEDNATGAPNAGRVGPYEKADLDQAEKLARELIGLQGQGQTYRAALDRVLASTASTDALKFTPTAIIRSDDVYGLFSTEPDLAGGFTDISPFLRTTDLSSDVSVYWREFKERPDKDEPEAGRDEFVNIPSFALAKFLKESKSNKAAYLWNEESGEWDAIYHAGVVPGMTLLLPVRAGGYSERKGWTGNPDDKPESLSSREPRQALNRDPESEGFWQSLNGHTASVTKTALDLADALDLPAPWRSTLESAGFWHDLGKAHPRWQGEVPLNPEGKPGPWGKFVGKFQHIPKVRHEAFSLLAAWFSQGTPAPTKLALYLIASHHGKIRTVLRSSGHGDNLFGWKSGDALRLPDGQETRVDLSVRDFTGAGQFDWDSGTFLPARPSWISLIDELLGPAWKTATVTDPVTEIAVPPGEPRSLGPFQLAYLEAIFRAADAQASGGKNVPEIATP